MRNTILVAGLVVGTATAIPAGHPNGMGHDMGNGMGDGHHHMNETRPHHDNMHPCDKYHQEDPQMAGECHQAVESCYMLHSEEGHEEMMATCIHDGCVAWFNENPAQAEDLEMSVSDTCWAFINELHEHYNGKDDHEKMHPCDKHHMDNEEHQSQCHAAVTSCYMMHSEEGHEEMMGACIHEQCTAWFEENPEEVAKLDGESVETACWSFLHELDEHFNGKDDHHHEKMHPCDKHHMDNEEHQSECHEAVNGCYMMHNEEGHEEMMASCIHAECAAWFAENPDQVAKLDGESIDDACWSFLEELHEHYNGKDEHHEDKHDMHPCDKHHMDNEEHQSQCHEAVNSCYMMHSEEGHEEMMASCIHAECAAWFAENPDQVAKLDGESIDDACWSFLEELHEHYDGKDDHHDDKYDDHPCDKHHGDNSEDQKYCHEAVNSCWMEHNEEGHEEMMASCIHAKCTAWFGENPEEIAKLDGKSADEACWSFLEELDEHFNGKDDHHEEKMHPCDTHDNPEDQVYCHESVNGCWMDHNAEGHEEMLASCIHEKCAAWFAENPEEHEKLDGKSVDEACSSFMEELYHYFEMDHDHDEPSKPMKLNKHHPCTMMQADHQEGCVENYKQGVRKCENGDDKKCLEKQCKKNMKDSEKEFGMMYFHHGGEIEDHKQFCKDFIKQHFKFQKKGGDEDEKLSKHHPCQLMPKENHADCAKDYEKVYSKCWGKDSSNNKMKKCLKKECEKKLVDGEFEGSEAKDLCTQMEKQSRKYQKKMNKD